MSTKASKAAQLAALRAARSGTSSRAAQWSSKDQDVYDEVSADEYDKIVKARLEREDFIEDDDGGGYADDGQEDWSGDDERGAAKDSEEEDEREERKRAKKAKKAAAVKKRPAPKPLPVPSADAYRPKISAAKENDFMASLLGGMIDPSSDSKLPRSLPSAPPMRKRRSSPPPPALSRREEREGKKARVSFVKDEQLDGMDIDSVVSRAGAAGSLAVKEEGGDFGMEMMVGSPEWPASDGDDKDDDMTDLKLSKADSDDSDEEMGVKKSKGMSIAAPSTSNGPAKRVNASSIRTKPVVRSAPTEDDMEVDEGPAPTPAWLSLADSLATESTPPMPSSDDVRSSPPPPSSSRKRNDDGPVTTNVDAFVPSMATSSDDDDAGQTLHMYWLDFFEQEIKTDEGNVKHLYLIGKVWDRAAKGGRNTSGKPGKWVSCCLKVDGLERNLFVCPRERTHIKGQETDMIPDKRDIYSEFDQKRREYGVGKWMGKWVKRSYAFGVEGIPNGESEYLKVIYGFDQPPLPATVHGNTFGHVLGTNTSPFEIFVLKRKVMGPCWLEIKNCKVSGKGMSWCKLEVIVNDPKNVRPMGPDEEGATEMPTLTVMSIAARTIVNHKDNTREMVCATARVWESANIDDPTPPEKQPSSIHTVVRPLGEWPTGFVQRAKNERSKVVTAANEAMLLSNFLVNIAKHDPDVIVGHDFLNVSAEVLLQRMGKHKTRDWSKMGRIKRKGNPPTSNRFGSVLALLAGRLVCDLSSDGAKTMITSTTWSLTEMCATQLKIAREDIDPDDTHTFFDGVVSSPERLLRFVRHCEVDAFFQMAISAKVQILPLTKQLTTLSGNSWNRTLNGGRAERNEYILLHEFHKLKYICPDKFQGKNKAAILKAEAEDGDGAATATTKTGGKRDKFKGGLVFEPKRGLWDKFVLVMDFNSLYPSIIQEYNIDFTTISVTTQEDADGEEKIPDVPQSDVQQGVLPRLIAQLVNRRREVKGLMKGKISPMLMMQYDIRQKALKLTANSMYGCLGFEYSRFYARPLAALTTFKGREILTSTKELAESIQLDVVYGDTDSVFVNSNVTDFADAMVIANTFKKLVNDKYRLLEIDLDGVFKRVLLLQKKKYAALKVESDGSTSTEIKGLDMKRREFSNISKTVSQFVLEQVLSGEATEVCIDNIHEYLQTVGQKVKDGKVDIDDFIINKRLGKNPEDYPDAKNQPQVQVALRIKARGGSARAGDVMQYVFCLGADGKSSKAGSADRAFTVDEVKKDPDLKIDYEYYLSTQILPPIERLCEPIEGTDRARLAECLGLNPDRYSTKTIGDIDRDFQTLGSKVSDAERFADSSKLDIRCVKCGSGRIFGGIQDDLNGHISPAGLVCPTCSAGLATPSVMVQLENQIRQHISKYYEATMVCDDSSCSIGSTRAMGVYPKRCMGPACKGQMHLAYTDAALYDQLLYYHSLFDGEKAVAAVKGTPREDEVVALAGQNKVVFGELSAIVKKYLDRNGRGSVSLGSIFSFMNSSRGAWSLSTLAAP